MTDINKMTRDEIMAVPYRKSWDSLEECRSLVIVPAKVPRWSVYLYWTRKFLSRIFAWISVPDICDIKGMHDSGYRCMDFVAVRDGEPVCRLSGCSDVIHIDGIGGYGRRGIPEAKLPTSWHIDCLPTSGLLHIFNGRRSIVCGASLSSFEIYAEEPNADAT